MPQMGSAAVVLLGMMGSGKTTVGRALAARTGWPYMDNDELVRAVTGRAPAEIDAIDGDNSIAFIFFNTDLNPLLTIFHYADRTVLDHQKSLIESRECHEPGEVLLLVLHVVAFQIDHADDKKG